MFSVISTDSETRVNLTLFIESSTGAKMQFGVKMILAQSHSEPGRESQLCLDLGQVKGQIDPSKESNQY